MSYGDGRLSRSQMHCPCHLQPKTERVDVSITYLTLLVYREWNSIMELTYPVWITFLEDTGNDKDEVTSHLSPLKFLCFLWYSFRRRVEDFLAVLATPRLMDVLFSLNS